MRQYYHYYQVRLHYAELYDDARHNHLLYYADVYVLCSNIYGYNSFSDLFSLDDKLLSFAKFDIVAVCRCRLVLLVNTFTQLSQMETNTGETNDNTHCAIHFIRTFLDMFVRRNHLTSLPCYLAAEALIRHLCIRCQFQS